MEVHGNQSGNIQNADQIVNYGAITSTISSDARAGIAQLLREVGAAQTSRLIDRHVAENATRELTIAAETADPSAARSAVQRAGEILRLAAGAAPLAEAAARIVGMMTGHPGAAG